MGFERIPVFQTRPVYLHLKKYEFRFNNMNIVKVRL